MLRGVMTPLYRRLSALLILPLSCTEYGFILSFFMNDCNRRARRCEKAAASHRE
jgi:hypothetical protein